MSAVKLEQYPTPAYVLIQAVIEAANLRLTSLQAGFGAWYFIAISGCSTNRS